MIDEHFSMCFSIWMDAVSTLDQKRTSVLTLTTVDSLKWFNANKKRSSNDKRCPQRKKKRKRKWINLAVTAIGERYQFCALRRNQWHQSEDIDSDVNKSSRKNITETTAIVVMRWFLSIMSHVWPARKRDERRHRKKRRKKCAHIVEKMSKWMISLNEAEKWNNIKFVPTSCTQSHVHVVANKNACTALCIVYSVHHHIYGQCSCFLYLAINATMPRRRRKPYS